MNQLNGQISIFDQDMPCGKMSLAHFPQIKAKTSELSSKSSAKSKTKQPMFLDLRTGSGKLADISWVTGIPSHGEFSMHNFGESPNVAEESGLWQILEANVPLKYFLSAKACAGVLRRVERRGKILPEILKTALEQQIERWQKYGSPLPQNIAMQKLVLYPSCARTLTARQDGSPCIDRGQEIVVERCGAFLPLAGDKAGSVAFTENGSPTLRATSPTACVVGIDIYNGATTGNVSKTLNSAATDSDHIPCVVCYDARENGDGKICPTVTGDHNNRVCDYGTTLICERHAGNSSGNDIAGTIDMHYYLGCGARNGNEREFVVFSIDRASFNQGENAKYGMSISDDGIAQTVVAKGPGAVCYNQKGEENPQYIVRRLTPLECGRLQGMPDFWCRDIPHSDANEYKMYGNGMALPNALYVMEGFMK